MDLDNIYSKILDICKNNYIVEPYVVGGVPRNIYLNNLGNNVERPFETRERSSLRFEGGRNFNDSLDQEDYRDIDVTTNDADITRLAITLADQTENRFKLFGDGHASVYLDDIMFDFSSNFISDNVVEYIGKELNIKDENLFEVYSREFTINTLHKRFFDDEIFDFTNQGKEDLERKLIKTVVPANIALSDDLRRVYRAINFAARFKFSIDNDIIEYARANREKFTGEKKWVLKEAFITSIVGESIDDDADITMHYLSEMNLLPTVPLVGRFKEEIVKRKLVNKYLDDAIHLSEYKLKTLDF
tara:strand:+ start:354 stop:1259 length:906 start_codon:yes stop_codon:yes gene_type:complete